MGAPSVFHGVALIGADRLLQVAGDGLEGPVKDLQVRLGDPAAYHGLDLFQVDAEVVHQGLSHLRENVTLVVQPAVFGGRDKILPHQLAEYPGDLSPVHVVQGGQLSLRQSLFARGGQAAQAGGMGPCKAVLLDLLGFDAVDRSAGAGDQAGKQLETTFLQR